jgi:hypothetical protein
VEADAHLFQLIIYVHANAVKHGFAKEFTDCKWSSYSSLLSDKPTALARNKVLEIFGGSARFIITHREQVKYYYESPFVIED